jgi:hypothetical protein
MRFRRRNKRKVFVVARLLAGLDSLGRVRQRYVFE